MYKYYIIIGKTSTTTMLTLARKEDANADGYIKLQAHKHSRSHSAKAAVPRGTHINHGQLSSHETFQST